MKPSKGDQIKVIHKEDSFSEDYQNGDIFTVEDTWYGGVQVKTALGVPLALSESEYEPYRETPQAGLPEGEFVGKIAVVTGGVRGIGKTICEEFRKAGACLLYTSDAADEL